MSLAISVKSYTTHGGIVLEIDGTTDEEHALLRSLRNAKINHWVGEESDTGDGKAPFVPILHISFPERKQTKK